MASDAAVGSQPPAQLVGNAFVQQFYHVLHQSPELVHRFYQESSKLGRPGPDGAMESVTTMQAINEKILAMDYGELKAEIKTVDAQESLDDGVIVLVTGYLMGKDLVKKDFTQSFFLAPQDKGFFVLNDIFRYVDEDDHQLGNAELANGTAAAWSTEEDSPSPHEEPVQEPAEPSTLEEEEEENEEEVYNPPEKEEDTAVVEEEAPVEEVIDEVRSVPEAVTAEEVTPPTTVHEEAPKKSYASIVKVMKENPAPMAVPIAAPFRPAPASHERHSSIAPAPAQVPVLPAEGSNVTETNNAQEAEADGYSIYIKSLPLSATPAQVEEEFKKFGPIKPGGVQVRSNKIKGFCFGFVEFEVASSVQSAIEASPVTIGGRQALVEEKRTTTLRGNNRGRFAPGRGSGFRGDGIRGHGSYGSGRGYGRGDYNSRGDFGSRGGRGGGSSIRGGDVGYQRVDQGGPTGGGRGGRSDNSFPKSGTPWEPAAA